MLPSVVFTHLNGAQPAARLPEPVTIGKWAQPAFSTAGLLHGRPAGQAVADDVAAGGEVALGDLLDLLLAEALDHAQPQPSRLPVERGLHGGHDRRLAGGTPAALAALALAAEVGV